MKKNITVIFCVILFISYTYLAYAEMLPPQWTVAVNVESEVFLTWEMSKGSARTIVYKKNKDEGKFTAIKYDALGFYVDKNVGKGVWIYKLQLEDSKGNLSDFSSERIIIVKGKKKLDFSPPKWGDLFADEDSILLRWDDTSDVQTLAYNLYRKIKGEKEYKLIASEPGIKSYKDTDVTVGQMISYKICPIGVDSHELGCSEPAELEVKKAKRRKKTRVRQEFKVRKTKLVKFLKLPDEMRFKSPTDIKVDKTGKIYVSDTGTGQIYVFKYSGEYEKTLGVIQSEDGKLITFENLLGIDVDDKGIVYGVDSYKGILRAINQKNEMVFEINLPVIFQEYEEYNFTKYGLVDVSVDNKSKTINIVDNYNCHIYRFDFKGNLLGVYLKKGQNYGQIHMPTFSFIDKKSRLFLSDTMNQKVAVFGPNMEPELEFGPDNDIMGAFIRAKGIAMDGKGDIYIADSLANTVQVFSSKGKYKYVLGDKKGNRPDFVTPNGIFIDKRDKIYLVEKLINRIQVRKLTDQFVMYKPKQKKGR